MVNGLIGFKLNSNKFSTESHDVITNDFDNYTTEGIYFTSDYYGMAHAPANKHDSCFMLVFGKTWIIQIAFSTYTNDGIYVRINFGEGEGWNGWKIARYS